MSTSLESKDLYQDEQIPLRQQESGTSMTGKIAFILIIKAFYLNAWILSFCLYIKL